MSLVQIECQQTKISLSRKFWSAWHQLTTTGLAQLFLSPQKPSSHHHQRRPSEKLLIRVNPLPLSAWVHLFSSINYSEQFHYSAASAIQSFSSMHHVVALDVNFHETLISPHSHPSRAHSILQQGWIVWDRKVPNKLEMKTITPASRTHLRNHLTSIHMKVHARCACVVSAVYTRMLHAIRVENTFNVQWCPRALYLMNPLNLSSASEQCETKNCASWTFLRFVSESCWSFCFRMHWWVLMMNQREKFWDRLNYAHEATWERISVCSSIS